MKISDAEKSGIPATANISADDPTRFVQLEREREERFAVIDHLRETFKDIPPEETEREAERSVTQARARLKRASHPVARSA